MGEGKNGNTYTGMANVIWQAAPCESRVTWPVSTISSTAGGGGGRSAGREAGVKRNYGGRGRGEGRGKAEGFVRLGRVGEAARTGKQGDGVRG